MLIYYNETNKPWVRTPVKDNIYSLSKGTRYVNKTKEEVEKSAYILIYGDINNASQTETTNMTELINIDDNRTNVYFNIKSLSPFVTYSKNLSKDVCFISLDVTETTLIGVSNNKSYTLEGYIKNNELTMICSLNDIGGSTEIILYNRKLKELIKYTFKKEDDGTVSMTKTNDQKYVYLPKHGKYTSVKKFRPSRPTKVILCHFKNLEALKKVIDEEHHEIIVYNKNTIDSVIEKLRGDKYKAVTLFIDDVDTTSNLTKKLYGLVNTKLVEQFMTYYHLYNNKIINKIRF